MVANIFIVTSGRYDDYDVNRVFSKLADARRYCDVHNSGSEYEDYEVEEWPVDDWDTEEIARTLYTCYIYIDTGEVRSESNHISVERPEVRHIEYTIRDKPLGYGFLHLDGRKYVGGNSYVSKEHALEIAADRRAIILAEQAAGLRDENYDKIIVPMTMVGIMKAYSKDGEENDAACTTRL